MLIEAYYLVEIFASKGASMVTKEIHDERLRQLRRVVLAAPEHLFMMNHMVCKVDSCGTAYCASGWAALDPWFIAQGLRWSRQPVDDGSVIEYWDYEERYTDFGALEVFFGLEENDSDALFGATLDPNKDLTVPKESVIANIDRLLAGQSAQPYS